jgi:HlyD family secretion protein
MGQHSKLFRKRSLEQLQHLSSPEGLDQLVQVISPKSWLALTCLSSLGILFLFWAIFGQVPVTITGRGVLIHPGKVVEFQSPSLGKLVILNVRSGDIVKKGDLLGVIDDAELHEEIRQQQAKLAETTQQNQQITTLQARRTVEDLHTVDRQRNAVQESLNKLQRLAPALNRQELSTIAQQRSVITQKLHDTEILIPELHSRFVQRQALQRNGALSKDVELDAQQEYLKSLHNVSELKAALAELDTRTLKAQQSYQENSQRILELRAELKELEGKAIALTQQNKEIMFTRANEVQEIRRKIDQLNLRLEKHGQILSQYSGRVLEVTTAVGQVLQPGRRLGYINVENSLDTLQVLIYFPIKDGKRVIEGMQAEVTPDTVRRERFGGIISTVKSVSAFPATKQGAENLIGNSEIVESLLASEPMIEVVVELQRDPSTASGYRWSSSAGPRLTLSDATTVSAHITLEKRSPIKFLLPHLRYLSGL